MARRRRVVSAAKRPSWLAVLLLACLTSALGAEPMGDIDPALRDLPLVEVPARGVASGTTAIFLSGDGGWAELDKGTSDALAARGVAVVGFDMRAYLMHRKSPDQAAADVARIVRASVARGARRVVLVGYSRGATVLPFVATRLPADVTERVALVAMIGLETTANFQFHWIDVVRAVRRDDDVRVLPEVQRLRAAQPAARMLCVYGVKEDDSACRDAAPALLTRVAHAGDHHFDRDWAGLAGTIVGALPR